MSRDTDNTVAVIGCVGLIPAILLGWVLKAWAIITLWGWFIAPTWHIATPSRQAAVGLVILFTAISGVENGSGDPDQTANQKLLVAYFRMLCGPLLSVFAGWCARQWL